jgi:N-methylhydantoinase A/oxoprolinase/acetone carboxylase beta subunit
VRIGVDVGGTHTDAVVLDGNELVGACKSLTSEDIESGVLSAVREVLKQCAVAPASVEMMTLGTTQFTNAVVERRGLARIGAIRIGAQSSSALPVAAKWPVELQQAVLGAGAEHTHAVNGGFEYDGTEIVAQDDEALRAAIAAIGRSAVEAVAVTSVFATSNNSAERRAEAMLREQFPGIHVSVSHRLGRIGLYQRENATLLNAALLPMAKRTVAAFERAFDALGLRCPFFISQNDGTLMHADFARHYPVYTFSSGPTNSMRGAAWLTDAADAMVVDVGGTTSDIGMLIDRFPRPSGSAVRIGGVLTNFRMPDVLAVGLGGGSRVVDDGQRVGPASVGRELVSAARVFGGEVLTATDIAVAAGVVDIGDAGGVSDLPDAVIETARQTMRLTLEAGVERMKTSAVPLPLIVVGGGGFLVPDALAGVDAILRPDHGNVANAIGAAFAQIGGEAESMYSTSRCSRADALASVERSARERAIRAGARADTVDIVEVDEVPISYADEPGAVIRMKAVGDADLARLERGGVR